MSRWVFLGMPGAGKGTQAALLAAYAGLPHVSTGVMFRSAVKEGTPAGREAKKHLDSGQLVPDEVVLRMVEERLSADDCRQGFLLDGYPRNLSQAEALTDVLGRIDAALDGVLFFVISEAEAQRRMRARAEKEGRSDDTPEVIRERLKVYQQQTEPLVGYYTELGLLERIQAEGTIGQVFDRLLAVVKSGA